MLTIRPRLPPSVSVLHAAVPGRARLRVAGLQNRPDLKAALETELAGTDGIRRVSANVVTSTLLIHFEPGRELPEVVGTVELIVRTVDLTPYRTAAGKPTTVPEPGRSRSGRLSFWSFLKTVWRSAFRPAIADAVTARAPIRAAAGPASLAWHTLPAADVARFWESSRLTGLTSGAAAERLSAYGPNVLPHPQPRSAFQVFMQQLRSLPVALLLGSAALSILTGGIADAVVIGAVVLLNASIGAMTEFEAERTITSLMALTEPIATVVRGRRLQRVGAAEVVPGDVLVLARGVHVAADVRLLETEDLTIDESALTGESMPVEKGAEAHAFADVPLADRRNMAYRGTVVTGGSGIGVVVATGTHTEIGKIQALIAASEQPQTPLQRQMELLGRKLVWFTGAVAGAVFVVGLLRGYSALEMLRSAVSLAVAAVPEGLPTVATVGLASAVRSLAERRVLVRRLDAVEALGTVQVVCFDKTGTLTLNEMSVVACFAAMHRYDVSGGTFFSDGKPVQMGSHSELLSLMEICSLCSEAEAHEVDGALVAFGTPTESALVRMAINSGIDVRMLRRQKPLVRMVHRARGQNYMTTVHEAGGGRTLLAVKGSPEEVLRLCACWREGGAVRPLSDADRRLIAAENEHMAAAALRVLGAACLDAAGEVNTNGGGLVWLGLIGIADPPRQGLRDLIGDFRQAGIRPVMVTGDQGATARAIGQALGMNGAGDLAVIDTTDSDGAERQEIGDRLTGAQIFARVSPAQKLQIVRAFQGGGEVVAMTGDGINDGPALKAADVGIALGQSGTRVAREVADIVLTDDNIHALLPAIQEGRRVHANIRKAIRYVSATNLGEVLVMFGALAGGVGQALNPRQLLWINLITDVFPELSLALAPPDNGIMKRPPADPRAPVIGAEDYGRLGLQSSVMAGAALAAYAYAIPRHGIGARASTMAFLTLTSAQLLHVFTEACPPGTGIAESGVPRNPLLWMSAMAGFATLALSQFGLTGLLGTARIGLSDALVCAGASFLSFMANRVLDVPPAAESSQTRWQTA